MLTKIDIRQMDLNLLPKFRALYQRRSVSDAARDLFVTQSAVSNALAKMRQLFGDDLFVRTSAGMVPTPLAHAIREAIEPALGMLENGLETAGSFNPELNERVFNVSMSQMAELLLLPHIIKATVAAAPGVSIRSSIAGRHIPAEDLRSGSVDIAVGVRTESNASIHSQTVGTCPLVCILREGHPALATSIPKSLSGYEFLKASDGGPTATRFEAASLLSIPSLVAATDLIGIVPEWLADRCAASTRLVVLDSPFKDELHRLDLAWHGARENDRGHRWLREIFATAVAAAALGEPSTGGNLRFELSAA